MTDSTDSNLGPNSQTSGLAKRELGRDSLFLQAQLRFMDGKELGAVRVRNLSAGGLMAEAAVLTKRGDPVELELRNIGWISGHVAWVAEGRFGIAFDHPIDPKLVRQPVGQGKQDLPRYLRKTERAQAKKRPLRRV